MALINKSTIHRAHINNDFYSNLKEAIKYFDDPARPPVVTVSYLTKDELNRARLWSIMIVKEYDLANGVETFRDSLERIAQIDNFYKFMIPEKGS